MSKEYLEAFEVIRNKFIDLFHEDIPDFDIVDNALNRLESIDNSEPSEALECLERIGAEKLARGELIRNDDKVEPYLNTIKQALLKAQGQNEVIVELCEYYGLDNLYPYDDLDTIEHYLKNARDISSKQRLELLGKLNKLEKENAELRLKAQELPEPFKTGVDIGVIKPKQYLKWDDLEFSYGTKTQKVRMNDTIYKIVYANYDNTKEIQLLSEDEKLLYISFVGKYKDNVQLFNDLHLERVEE